ncbi:MAG TPA: M10 family metallopeptidase [Stellaceae bacterium]|nr:M10 family metallopeptidase [Stellaceae bacterium]
MTIPYYVYDLLEGDGYRWNFNEGPPGTPTTVTWAFLGAGTGENGDTIAALDASQQQAVQTALAYIEQFCDITFAQTTDAATADITFGIDTNQTGSTNESGIAYWTLESNGGADFLTQATIYLSDIASNFDMTPGFLTSSSIAAGDPTGGSGWLTLLHEIGHALGLKHPFDANDVSDPNSVLDTAHASEDNHLYSVMSYQAGPSSGYLNTSTNYIFNLEPRSYGVFDIAALQYIYGAAAATSLSVLQSIDGGDGVSGSAGAFTYTFTPGTAVFATIGDGGTNDALDFSSFADACTIDLSPGSFSSLGIAVDVIPPPFIDPDVPPSPYAAYDGENALAIAYGTTVTTCIGGAGNDTIIGNAANDRLDGGPGSNTIEGGTGVNTAVYAGRRAEYSIGFSAGAVTVTGDGSADTLTQIQYLSFADATIKTPYPVDGFYGNATSDILWWNSASGQASIWEMGGTSNIGGGPIGVLSTTWEIAGSGDFNRDGSRTCYGRTLRPTSWRYGR